VSVLQLSLLILAIAAIGIIGFISYRRNEGPPRRESPSVMRDDSQMDLLQQESAASRFDEFGVGEPRVRSARPDEIPPAPANAAEAPPPAYKPSLPPIQSQPSARRDPSIGSAKPVEPKASRNPPTVDRPATVSAAGPKAGSEAPQKIIAMFVARTADDPLQGPDIYSAFNHLALEPGQGLSYQRKVDGTPWFHIASMVKPGLLDPGEAIGFSTPGLSMFLVLPGPPQPLDAFDDMLATAVRLAERLGAHVLDDRQQLLGETKAQALRSDVLDWAQRYA
jgi:cell division protein ZipA